MIALDPRITTAVRLELSKMTLLFTCDMDENHAQFCAMTYIHGFCYCDEESPSTFRLSKHHSFDYYKTDLSVCNILCTP